mgnify:CR=1 FL=1|jgi:2-polyprenyl-3-methyl-5-hydroxy-6-metoxy-1,4-benzoquinol methylase
MVKLEKCPICEAVEIRPSHQSFGELPILVDYGFGKLGASVSVSYSECLRCGVEFQNPRMPDDDVTKFYSEGFYRKAIKATEKEMDLDEFNRAERITGKISRFYEGKLLPNSCLDFGCGKGHLVTQLSAKFPDAAVNGVDYDWDYTDIVQRDSDYMLDLITLIHSLEHVISPLDILDSLVERFEEGGHLVIEVPSSTAIGGAYRLAHTFVFTAPSLVYLCKLAGLEVLSIEADNNNNIMVICRK